MILSIPGNQADSRQPVHSRLIDTLELDPSVQEQSRDFVTAKSASGPALGPDLTCGYRRLRMLSAHYGVRSVNSGEVEYTLTDKNAGRH